jgi:hypothetical protein
MGALASLEDRPGRSCHHLRPLDVALSV